MTLGVTAETADGMNLVKVQALIDTLRQERYRWRPVRRLYVEKEKLDEEATARPSDLVG